jgi:hypothetical protein
MKKILLLLSTLFLLLSVQSQEVWLTERLDFEINENSKYKIEFQTRYNYFIYYDHTDVGYSYHLMKNLSLNTNLRLTRFYSDYNLKPHFSFDYNFNGIGIKPKIEFNINDSTIDVTYRTKLYFNAPITNKFYVYSATEWFISNNTINKFRIYAGIQYKISNADLILYYMKDETYNNYYTETHIIGVSTIFYFKL